ncbi:MAG: hypothetical protein ACTSYX_06805 [Candidatus Thorarchaeota archaeon]
MTRRKRLGRFLLVVGIAIMLVSVVGLPGGTGLGSTIVPSEYLVTTSEYLGACQIRFHTMAEWPADVYLLNWNDTNRLLMSGSLKDTHPLYAWENVTMFSALVLVPNPGYYSIVITPATNMTVSFTIDVVPVIPQHFVLIVGAAASIVGAVITKTEGEE